LHTKRPTAARPASLAAAFLLLFAAAVAASRAARIFGGKELLDAPSERRFFAWAYRDPAALRALAATAPAFRFGETVCICDLSGRLDPGWLRVMATYELAHQVVLVPATSAQARTAPPCRRTALLLRADGSFLLERTARGAPP
jgi:hypothetical protein